MITYDAKTPEEGMKRVEALLDAAIEGIYDGAKQIADQHVVNLYVSAISKNLVDTQAMTDSIRRITVDKGHHTVTLSQTGFWVDGQMPNFPIRITPDKAVYQWCLNKGNAYMHALAKSQGKFKFKNHPFIKSATDRTLAKGNDILKNSIEAATRSVKS